MTCACPDECSPRHESSPGVVDDQELILLVLVDPTTYKDGDLSASCFSSTQLKNGVQSVSRVQYSSADEIQRCVVQPLMSKGHKTLYGSAATTAKEIREIVGSGGEQVYCVVDDPIHADYADPKRPDLKFEVFPAHAHLGFSALTRVNDFWQQRNNKMAMMSTLADTFKRRGCPVPIESWFL